MSRLFTLLDYLDTYVVKLNKHVEASGRLKMLMYTLYLWDPARRGLIEEAAFKRAHSTTKRISSDDKLIELLTPPKPLFFIVYHIISNTMHTILLTWTVLMVSLSEGSTWKHMLHCHLPRFVFHQNLSQKYMVPLACLFSLIALSWRIWTYHDLNLRIHSLPYMMLDEQVFNAASGAEVVAKNYLSSELTLIQSILFYRIEDRLNRRIIFQRRPNRTPEGRALLEKLAQWGIVIIWGLVFGAALLLFPVGINTEIHHQDVLYPGCETSEQLHLYRLVVCFWTTTIFYFDNAFAIIIPTALTLYIIFDLLLYWRAIELKINRLLRLLAELRFSYEFHEEQEIRHLHPAGSAFEEHTDGSKLWIDFRPKDLKLLMEEREEVHREVQELQAMIGDFFVQLGHANKLVSRFLLLGAVAWLGINAFISASGLQTDSSGIIRVSQMFGLFSLSIMSSLAFWMKQNTEPAYQRINTLMALDMSADKLRWKVLLKYYTVNARYGFTLTPTVLYTQIVYIKLITYTFSFFTIINNFKSFSKT